jgi:hypothetical protein
MLFQDWVMMHFLCPPLIADHLSLNLSPQIPDQITPHMNCIRTIFDLFLYFRRAPRKVIEPKPWCVLLSPLETRSFPPSIFAVHFFENLRYSYGPCSDIVLSPYHPSSTDVNLHVWATAALIVAGGKSENNWLNSSSVQSTLKTHPGPFRHIFDMLQGGGLIALKFKEAADQMASTAVKSRRCCASKRRIPRIQDPPRTAKTDPITQEDNIRTVARQWKTSRPWADKSQNCGSQGHHQYNRAYRPWNFDRRFGRIPRMHYPSGPKQR